MNMLTNGYIMLCEKLKKNNQPYNYNQAFTFGTP